MKNLALMTVFNIILMTILDGGLLFWPPYKLLRQVITTFRSRFAHDVYVL